ncbi:MAG: hypothetical protein HOW97_31755 [Catenulispora sp.]|nr:hypothetical protein [Catenulispora sp.]
MSVLMTLQVAGDPKAMEQYAQEHPDQMQEVLGTAKRHGLIAHRFYGSSDGENVLVVDEWPDRESFESFFQEAQSTIGPMFEAAQGKGEPTPMYWKELATGDAYGWGA